MSVFVIEDDLHAERIGEFSTRELAMEELRRISALPYGEPPNAAPCESAETCRRDYVLFEFETGAPEWKLVRRESVVSTSAAGTEWVIDA